LNRKIRQADSKNLMNLKTRDNEEEF